MTYALITLTAYAVFITWLYARGIRFIGILLRNKNKSIPKWRKDYNARITPSLQDEIDDVRITPL
jgi:hypothetical protein